MDKAKIKEVRAQDSTMITSSELALILGVSLSHARRMMEKMPHINVALPDAKKRMLRVYRKDTISLYCNGNISELETNKKATRPYYR